MHIYSKNYFTSLEFPASCNIMSQFRAKNWQWNLLMQAFSKKYVIQAIIFSLPLNDFNKTQSPELSIIVPI